MRKCRRLESLPKAPKPIDISTRPALDKCEKLSQDRRALTVGILLRKRACDLEKQGPHAAHLALLLDKDLQVLVDDGHGEKDTGAGADCAHKVGQDGQGADTKTAKGRGSGDVPKKRSSFCNCL